MGKLALIPISILIILASPFVLWNAESQNRVQDFGSAEEVSSNSDEEGYILIEGTADTGETLACPNDTEESCLYVSSRTEVYSVSQEKVCQTNKPTDRVIDNLESECEAGSCTPCYLVEKTAWENEDSSVNEIEFSIGSYEIPSIRKANRVGFETYEEILYTESHRKESDGDVDDLVDEYFDEDISSESGDPYYDTFDDETNEDTTNSESERRFSDGDRRVTYTYLKADEELVIAGNARNGEISEADEEFVVSALSYSETLDELEAQDSSAKWGLRILSLGLMVAGFLMLFGTIASIPLALTKIVPFIGDDISSGISGVVTGVAGVLGFVLWLILFGLISILKSTVALVIIGIILLVVIGFVVKRMQEARDLEVKRG